MVLKHMKDIFHNNPVYLLLFWFIKKKSLSLHFLQFILKRFLSRRKIPEYLQNKSYILRKIKN